MSHEEAVAFLRQCENEVQLQLYRDPAQTPITALSPTESHRSFRPKPVLRQEAVDMLCTLAVKKLSPGDSDILNSKSRFLSSSPSPRRKKLTKMSRESELINLNLEKIDQIIQAGGGGGGDDDDILITTETSSNPNVKLSLGECEEPVSLPPISTTETEFNLHGNPIYQSVHNVVQSDGERKREKSNNIEKEMKDKGLCQRKGSQSLLKWKGIVFPSTGNISDQEKDSKNKDEEVSYNVFFLYFIIIIIFF